MEAVDSGVVKNEPQKLQKNGASAVRIQMERKARLRLVLLATMKSTSGRQELNYSNRSAAGHTVSAGIPVQNRSRKFVWDVEEKWAARS